LAIHPSRLVAGRLQQRHQPSVVAWRQDGREELHAHHGAELAWRPTRDSLRAGGRTVALVAALDQAVDARKQAGELRHAVPVTQPHDEVRRAARLAETAVVGRVRSGTPANNATSPLSIVRSTVCRLPPTTKSCQCRARAPMTVVIFILSSGSERNAPGTSRACEI
jgi:hypothetical protein